MSKPLHIISYVALMIFLTSYLSSKFWEISPLNSPEIRSICVLAYFYFSFRANKIEIKEKNNEIEQLKKHIDNS